MQDEHAATAMTEPTSGFAEVSGLKLHYLDWGGDASRHTIVLCHGGSAHCHWWDEVAPQLVRLGKVIALDFRGHGRSQWAQSYGPAAHISDLKAFLREHLRTRAVLVGHSMGGEIAQCVATACPELLEALIVVDSPHGGPPLKTRLMWRWKRRNQDGPRPEFRAAEDLVRKFRLSPPGHNLSPDALAQVALKGAERLTNGNWAFRFDPKTRKMTPGWRKQIKCRIQDLRMPVLILRGEHSALLTPSRARRMHRKIRHSILKEIPEAFHHVSLDNPDGTAGAIAEFIAALPERQLAAAT
jgi:pimeloyl-ACP methyl ester carboxylesterase